MKGIYEKYTKDGEVIELSMEEFDELSFEEQKGYLKLRILSKLPAYMEENTKRLLNVMRNLMRTLKIEEKEADWEKVVYDKTNLSLSYLFHMIDKAEDMEELQEYMENFTHHFMLAVNMNTVRKDES